MNVADNGLLMSGVGGVGIARVAMAAGIAEMI